MERWRPLNLESSEDQMLFRRTTRKFLEAELPLSAVRDLYHSSAGFDRGWWVRAAELGWTSMFVPESLGGGSLSGNPAVDVCIVAEEMGRLASPGPLIPVNVVSAGLTDAARQSELSAPLLAALSDLLTGRSVAAWAFCEPGKRWDVSTLASTAVADGDELVVNGIKAYVEAASAAEYFLVTARTEKGLSQVLVPAGVEGLTVAAGRSIDMTRRFGKVRLNNVRLPLSYAVGSPALADESVARQLAIAICLQCAEMCGVAGRTLEMTIDYGRDRCAFGRPIVSFQALKHRMADMAVHLEGSKAVTDALSKAIDTGSDEALRLASVAKAYVGEHCLDLVDDCIQITGGIGVTWEHDIHLYNRRAALNYVVFGSPDEHKEKLLQHLLADEGMYV